MKPPLITSSLAVDVVGDTVVLAMGSTAPSDDDWQRCMEFELAIPSDRRRVLVWTDGAAPNAKQRARLNATLRGAHPVTAVITNSAVVRAIGVAMAWFNSRQRIFWPAEIDAALDHLGISDADRRAVLNAISSLRSALDRREPPPTAVR